MSLNTEKQQIINEQGNILVTANPGTGKTLLIAHKYAELIKNGTKPEEILCLTFTEKAKREMETRILKTLKKKEINIDLSHLNVFTFHGYALECIDEDTIISSNLLRYSIFKYLKEKKYLNYEDNYLIETMVPRLENSIRYLKSFGIKPEDINLQELELEETDSISKEEMDIFAEYYVDIYKYYEKIKTGIDYGDMLLNFLTIEKPRQYEYVLVDELQDVNKIEADIALKSAKNFIVVGDKKQAIFGFQGGSIQNFDLFKGKEFVLSENFRSTNQVLYYARSHFMSKTKEESHIEELKDLKNGDDNNGPKPKIYDIERKTKFGAAAELASKCEGKTAVIARTNDQILAVAKEMDARGIKYSSTFISASKEARQHIVIFLKGIFSNDEDDIKAALFTPYSPISLRDAFEVSSNFLLDKIPKFVELRESVKTVEDVNKVFNDIILPISIGYGQEYLDSASTLHNAFQEALMVGVNTIDGFLAYLLSTDILGSVAEEGEISLITVHKAKGKEFKNVIYLPSKPKNSMSLVDHVAEAILESKKCLSKEELEEENLRIDFVAFTRAEENLIIITDKVQDYIDDNADLEELDASSLESFTGNKLQRAYSLFVNGDKEGASKELVKESWIKKTVENYFKNLEHISYSSLPDKAYDYLKQKILGLSSKSPAMALGSEVHDCIQKFLEGKEISCSNEAKPYMDNAKKFISSIKEKYPSVADVEQKIDLPMSELGLGSSINFTGFIDAVFTDGTNYLIVDWKTDKNDKNASKHRQQLEIYKRAFSVINNIPIENISVAVAFIGLRGVVNTGLINSSLDERQPQSRVFDTVKKRSDKLLLWKSDVDSFFKDLIDEKVDDQLWRAVVEEYGRGD